MVQDLCESHYMIPYQHVDYLDMIQIAILRFHGRCHQRYSGARNFPRHKTCINRLLEVTLTHDNELALSAQWITREPSELATTLAKYYASSDNKEVRSGKSDIGPHARSCRLTVFR